MTDLREACNRWQSSTHLTRVGQDVRRGRSSARGRAATVRLPSMNTVEQKSRSEVNTLGRIIKSIEDNQFTLPAVWRYNHASQSAITRALETICSCSKSKNEGIQLELEHAIPGSSSSPSSYDMSVQLRNKAETILLENARLQDCHDAIKEMFNVQLSSEITATEMYPYNLYEEGADQNVALLGKPKKATLDGAVKALQSILSENACPRDDSGTIKDLDRVSRFLVVTDRDHQASQQVERIRTRSRKAT
ncbi:hypothetical protein I317_05340 [Kwoniella heveanensis CBS 569]|nr:hypothetical protein I317_05340 [Kwoniella heveanensis CBS 569]